MLRDIPKPVATIHVPEACEVDIDLRMEGNVVQTPITPVIPVNPEAVVSLQSIINQDVHVLDDTSKRRL